MRQKSEVGKGSSEQIVRDIRRGDAEAAFGGREDSNRSGWPGRSTGRSSATAAVR